MNSINCICHKDFYRGNKNNELDAIRQKQYRELAQTTDVVLSSGQG